VGDSQALDGRQCGTGNHRIAEHYRFVEENPAHSRVFFRKKVNFRILAELPGRAGRAVR
jgi:hypothetical protein